MRNSIRFMALALCLALVLPAMAQMTSSMNICTINVERPKPGMSAQYEAGRKKHMAWHKMQKDTWTWNVWAVTTGESTGSYLVGSCNHAWRDYDGRDKFEAADTANHALTVGPTVAGGTTSYYALRRDLSLNTDPLNAPYLGVVHFMLHPDSVNAFTEAIRKVSDAIRKTNYPAPPSQWYQLANGGEGPHFVLVQSRANMAAMQPPEKSLDEMMTEVYGKEQGPAILGNLRRSIRSQSSELLQYRKDLSYEPAK